jgi:iron(III) transport system ATP-binding protein
MDNNLVCTYFPTFLLPLSEEDYKMANVNMHEITVRYGEDTVINRLSLNIKNGENMAIVGPSSCGKTTLMRALCGFVKISEGEISIGDRIMSSVPKKTFTPPEKRNVGVVFQDYAVWPHLTVLENVIYPLRKQKIPKGPAQEKAMRALSQVKMGDFADRLPSQLSGGQQQRVALARALVSSEQLIVLDEPITNLDANLREEMSYEIKSLQENIGATIIYITHDQETAMAIADRMAIMDAHGAIRQVGTPEEIWNSPADKYVFDFLGVSNFLPVKYQGGNLIIADQEKTMTCPFPSEKLPHAREGLLLASRPMEIIFKAGYETGGFLGKVKRVTYLGNQFDYIVDIGTHTIRVQQDSYDAFQNGVPVEGSFYGIHFLHPVFYSQDSSARIAS